MANFKPHQLRALIDNHIQEGEFQKALNLYENLISQKNFKLTFDDWFNNGLCHFKCNHYAEAVNSYNMALDYDKYNFQVITNKAICLLKLDKTNDAFKHFREALSINPNIGPAWLHIGFNLIDNHFEKGVNAFRRAVRINPAFAEARGIYFPGIDAYGTVGYLLEESKYVVDMEDFEILSLNGI